MECHQKLWKGWRAFPKIVLQLFPQFPHATTRLFLHVELLLLSWKPGKMKTISELFHGMLCYIYTESESHACYWTQVLWSRFFKNCKLKFGWNFEIEMLPSLIIDILISRRNISFGKNNEPLGPLRPQQWFCVQSTSDFHWISNFYLIHSGDFKCTLMAPWPAWVIPVLYLLLNLYIVSSRIIRKIHRNQPKNWLRSQLSKSCADPRSLSGLSH